MKFISQFESFQRGKSILIVVDVQKSFKKFFNNKFLESLTEYCKRFDQVYQIFDNHHEGKSKERDYLYHDEPHVDNKSDLYDFPNQKDIIEKRYNYNVDVDFYKNILDKKTLQLIKSKKDSLKKGEYFKTNEGTIIVYIGNNHKWFHVPKKLYELFSDLREAQSDNAKITIVGGAHKECLEDVIITAESLGLKINRNNNYIYSATECPIS